MFSQVSKWGNSLGVRIPRVLAEQLDISPGTSVELVIENDHLAIRKATYSLDALLAQVTPENCHAEVDSGEAIGQELW